jgi:hypothetical protein
MDPLTQNRHALAGGNPISFMETDGHEPISSFQDGTYNACQGPCGGGSRSGTVSRGTEVAQRWTPGATRNQQLSHPKNPPTSDAATSGNRWPSRRASAITRKLPGTEHGDPTTAGGPVPNDKCFGCLDTPGKHDFDLGEVLTFVFGDSPLEIAVNLFPIGRGGNLARRAIGGIARAAGRGRRAAKAAPRGWQRGDDIWAKTRAGNDPAWSTVRGRYWKNAAEDPAQAAQWDAANLARMRTGRAPQRFNPDKGGMESMELSHEPIPARLGGRGLVPRWPQDHAAVDPFRHPGY